MSDVSLQQAALYVTQCLTCTYVNSWQLMKFNRLSFYDNTESMALLQNAQVRFVWFRNKQSPKNSKIVLSSYTQFWVSSVFFFYVAVQQCNIDIYSII